MTELFGRVLHISWLSSPGAGSSARWSQGSVLLFSRPGSLPQLPQVREIHCYTHRLCIFLSFQLPLGNQNCNLTVRNRRQARKKSFLSVVTAFLSWHFYTALAQHYLYSHQLLENTQLQHSTPTALQCPGAAIRAACQISIMHHVYLGSQEGSELWLSNQCSLLHIPNYSLPLCQC